MTTYIVTSDRLTGFKRGDTFQDDEATDMDINHLVESGHLSPQKVAKSAKTIDTEQKD